MKNKKIPIKIIKDRKEFQNNRVPEIGKEFELEKIVVEENKYYDGVVAIEPLDFSAKCIHHLVAISGKAYFAYMPDKYVIGLSQTSRILEYFLNVTKEIIQEEANTEIVNFFDEMLKPKGVWLVLKAKHDCMCSRGVRQRNARTTTSVMRGIFHTDQALRNETIQLWRLKS